MERLRRLTLAAFLGVLIAVFAGRAIASLLLGSNRSGLLGQTLLVVIGVMLGAYWFARLFRALQDRRSRGWIAVCILGLLGSIFAVAFGLVVLRA